MTRRPIIPFLYLFLVLSGFAGLGYQMVWTRMLTVGLGHEIVAVLAVVAAFFAGLALGAYALDARISRSPHPGRWYVALEALVGAWSLALILLIPLANTAAARLSGVEPSALRHWGVAFLLPFVLLLPATAAMGATLPAMERLVFRLRHGGRAVGGLYAANTFGAVAGTLITTLWLAPALGFTATLLFLATTNFVCAASTLALTGWRTPCTQAPRIAIEAGTPAGDNPTEGRFASLRPLALILFATGFLGIGYEVLIIRMLSQITEDTVYSFAAALAVYLLGTAAGGAAYQLLRPSRAFEARLATLLVMLALACLAGVGLLWVAKPAYQLMRMTVPQDLAGGVSAELAVAALLFLLPTLLMGATFAHLGQRIRDLRDRFGHAIAVNTLGAAAAPLAFGVGLLPAVGSKAALLAVPVGYLLLIPLLRRTGATPRWAAVAVLSAALALLLFAPASFRLVEVPAGGAMESHREGVMAAVSVISDRRGVRHLKVNDEFRMGSTASSYSDRRQSHIPLLLHPAPHRALFLGIGTGGTLAGVLDHPGLTADGVELVPEVVEMMPWFDSVLDGLRASDRVHVYIADARRFVRSTDALYDVIIADLYHPSRDGSGSLYTAEHFAAIRARLAPGGLFCQWLPLFQLDLPTLQTIIRTFLSVFPAATAHVGHYSLLTPMLCLVGSVEPRRYPADWRSTRRDDAQPEDARFRAALMRNDLDDAFALFGTFVAGPADLARFAGPGPINSDDLPVVTFAAPHAVYAPHSPNWGRLKALVQASAPEPSQLLTPQDAAQATGPRLAAYWRARDAFFAAGTGVVPSADAREMERQIREPLLAIVRISPDFLPAYRALLGLARDLARVDAAAAGALLADLDRADPQRDDARRLRAEVLPVPATTAAKASGAPAPLADPPAVRP